MCIYCLLLKLRSSERTTTIERTLWTDIQTDGHTDGHTGGHSSSDSDIVLYWL